MFQKPFRYETTCENSGTVFDRQGIVICEVIQMKEDDLTASDHIKLQLIVDALNQVKSELAQ